MIDISQLTLEFIGLIIGIGIPLIAGFSYLVKSVISTKKEAWIQTKRINDLELLSDMVKEHIDESRGLNEDIVLLKEKLTKLESEEQKSSKLHGKMFSILKELSNDVSFLKGRMDNKKF